MLTTIACGCLLILAPAGLDEMFDATVHDFGNVPRGSINVHRFVLTNATKGELKIASLSSSCKCATPAAERSTAQPGEKIVIAVIYDATTFTGARSMTITAGFEGARHETVTLRVMGFSRQDVVFNPGRVDFGTVPIGETPLRTVKVEYAGQLDWKIEEVVAPASVTVQIGEAQRSVGRVIHQVDVKIAPDAPAGILDQPIQLKTNDPASKVVQLFVSANVQPALVASPSALDLGNLRIGEKTTRRVMLHGKEPFTIKAVGGMTDQVKVRCTPGERTVHILSIEIEGGAEGTMRQDLLVHTDMRDQEPLSVHIAGIVRP